jgi:hypothetical protein
MPTYLRIDTLKNLIVQINNKINTDCLYDISIIRTLEETDKITVSTKIIYKCPCCKIELTSNYDSLLKIIKEDKLKFCINKSCNYYKLNRSYTLFDVQQIVGIRHQTLLSTDYKNVRGLLKMKCQLCNNERQITLLNFNNGRTCENTNCELHIQKQDKDGEFYEKKDHTGERIDHYSRLEKEGYTIITENITNIDTDCEIRCSNGHIFKSRVSYFNDINNGRKKSNFCTYCTKIESWNEVKKELNEIGINDIDIITTMHEFENKTISKLTIKCSNNHIHVGYLCHIIQLTNFGKYNCMDCSYYTKYDNKKEKIEIILKNNNAKLIELTEDDKVLYICKCGEQSENFYSNLIDNWTGHCIKCMHSNPVIVYNMAHGKYKQKDNTFILPSGKRRSYQGYESIVILFLLERKLIKENELLEDKIQIEYENDENKKKYYEPDFIIKNNMETCVCEVKSSHTYDKAINKIERLKKCVLEKYNKYIIYILSHNGKSITRISYIKIDGDIIEFKKIYDDEIIYTLYRKHKNKII